MSYIPLKCTQCGAGLPQSVNGEPVRCEYCGTVFYNEPVKQEGKRQPSDSEMSEIEQLVREGQKVKAIKLVRERKGIGLAEAKALVDTMDRELAGNG